MAGVLDERPLPRPGPRSQLLVRQAAEDLIYQRRYVTQETGYLITLHYLASISGFRRRRSSICLKPGMALVPSPSTAKDAAQAAKRAASRTSPVSVRWTRKPAAKTSPAPVGSTAVAGKASMWNRSPLWRMSAPLYPRVKATVATISPQRLRAAGAASGGTSSSETNRASA